MSYKKQGLLGPAKFGGPGDPLWTEIFSMKNIIDGEILEGLNNHGGWLVSILDGIKKSFEALNLRLLQSNDLFMDSSNELRQIKPIDWCDISFTDIITEVRAKSSWLSDVRKNNSYCSYYIHKLTYFIRIYFSVGRRK